MTEIDLFLKEIEAHVYNTVHANDDNALDRFIPIAFPRRFGKTTLFKTLTKTHDYNCNVRVVDNLEQCSFETFVKGHLPWFQRGINVLVVLYTPGNEDHFTTKLMDKCRGFKVTRIDDTHFETTHYDGIISPLSVKDAPFSIQKQTEDKKENEIKIIMSQFNTIAHV
jgi:hypothetical protein